MEINREKFRVAALLIALANTACGPRPARVNYREEETSWTGSAPLPTYVSPGTGPAAEGYPPGGYHPPGYEYVPPPYEYAPPPDEYYPPIYE